MTPADEIEKVTKIISDISDKAPYWSQSYIDIAKWHIHERKKAVLEARIDERGLVGWSGDDFSDRRIKELTAHLSELERGRND